MSNDIQIKRKMLLDAYPSPNWSEKVKRMSDNQVLAIYYRLKREGRVY